MIGMLSTENRVAGLIIIISFFLVTMDLIRRRKLSEQYAVIWIVTLLTLLILVVFDPVSLALMRLIGATNLASVLFLLAFMLVLGVLLDLSVKGAELSDKLRSVNQELGLLRERFERLEQSDSVLGKKEGNQC